jgi:hypothetical protein
MQPTFADVAYFATLEGVRAADKIPIFAGIPTDFLDKYPNIMAYRERMASLPRLKEYYKDAEGPFEAFKPLSSEEAAAPGNRRSPTLPPPSLSSSTSVCPAGPSLRAYPSLSAGWRSRT